MSHSITKGSKSIVLGLLLAASGSSLLIGSAYAQFNQELHDMLPDSVKQAGRVLAAGAYKAPPVLHASEADVERAAGLAPDLSAAIAEILGVEFEWRNVPWPGQIPGLQSGNFDVLWGQISDTPQRERELFDIVPFNQYRIGVLTRKSSDLEITGLENLCGLSIAVGVGSSFVTELSTANEIYCLANEHQAVVVREYSDIESPALLSGQVDAVMIPYGVARQMAERLPDVEAVALPLTETTPIFATIQGIATAKNNANLSSAIAGALQILHENGRWEEIAESHGLAEDIPEIEIIKTNPLTNTPDGSVVTN